MRNLRHIFHLGIKEILSLARDPVLLFRPARLLAFSMINQAMNSGQFTFIIDLPRKFQNDIYRGATPTAEIIADATAMAQAGRGPGYIGNIMNQQALPFWPGRADPNNRELVKLNTRVRFNPNVEQSWFVSINQIIN